MSTQKLPNHCQHKKQKLYLSTQNQKLNLSTQRYLNHCQHKNDQITDRNKDQCYTKHHPCQHNNYQLSDHCQHKCHQITRFNIYQRSKS